MKFLVSSYYQCCVEGALTFYQNDANGCEYVSWLCTSILISPFQTNAFNQRLIIANNKAHPIIHIDTCTILTLVDHQVIEFNDFELI